MHIVRISSLYNTLVQIEDTIGKLLDEEDYRGYELYMVGLDSILRPLVEDDLKIVNDDEYRNERFISKYVRVINNIRYLTQNGIMHPLLGVLIDYVEDFIYGGKGNED